MATSTEQINNLIGSNTALMEYFQGARDQIDADLDAAALRVGDTKRTIYVDQANGDNANDGTSAAPVQTLQKAVNMSVWGGILEVMLKGDYHHDAALIFRNGQVTIRSDTGGVKRRLTFADRVSDTDPNSPRFSSGTGFTLFMFKDITLELGTAAAHVTSKYVVGATGLTTVAIIECDIELPVGSDQNIMHPVNNHGMGLIVQSSSYPVEMAGRWIQGVAAATDPNSIKNIAFTNMNTL